MSTHNIGFYENLTKIYFNYHQLSSNTLIISSSDLSYDSLKPPPPNEVTELT